MIERTTIRLPEDLLRRAKRKAAAEGRTLTSLIADGLRIVIDDKPKSAKVKRVLPRVSKAAGGLVAGVVFDDLRSLHDIDDINYVQRLNRAE